MRAQLVFVGVLLSAVFYAGYAFSEEVAEVVHIEDQWTYRWGDPLRSAAGVPIVVDAEWKPMAAFTLPPGSDPHGILWIRVPLPKTAWRDPNVFAGMVVGAMEVYDDTGLRGRFGTVNPDGVYGSGGSSWLETPIGASREVFLRCQASAAGTPGPQRSLLIGERSAVERALVMRDLSLLLVAIVLLFSGIVALGAFAWRPSERIFAAFALFTLACGSTLLGIAGASQLLYADVTLWGHMASAGAVLFVPALCWFTVSARLAPNAKWFDRLTTVIGAGAAVSVIHGFLSADTSIPWTLLIILNGTIGLVALVVVTARTALAGDADARILSAGLATLLFVFVQGALPYIQGRVPGGFTLQWGLLVIAVCIALVGIRRFSHVLTELADRTLLLEAREQQGRTVNGRIVESSQRLVDVVETLRTTSGVHASGLARQASALQETQVTAEEIKRTSAMAAEKAKNLLAGAADAEEVGKAGDAALAESLAGLEAIRSEVAEIGRQIGAVNERATEIAEIVETVKDLADQSNMLALNAAIVAVRAGEHGKGFSIVAREVRRLADQSIQATRRIRQVLDGVSTSLRLAVQTSDRGAERVAAGLVQVRNSGEKLQRLGAIVRDSSSGVRQISAAITQQNAGVTQIFQAIEDLSRHMQETMERLRTTESTTTQVQEVSESLRTHATLVVA